MASWLVPEINHGPPRHETNGQWDEFACDHSNGYSVGNPQNIEAWETAEAPLPPVADPWTPTETGLEDRMTQPAIHAGNFQGQVSSFEDIATQRDPSASKSEIWGGEAETQNGESKGQSDDAEASVRKEQVEALQPETRDTDTMTQAVVTEAWAPESGDWEMSSEVQPTNAEIEELPAQPTFPVTSSILVDTKDTPTPQPYEDYRKYLPLVRQSNWKIWSSELPDASEGIQHDLQTAPLFSSQVREKIQQMNRGKPKSERNDPFASFGLLGIRDRSDEEDAWQFNLNPEADLIFSNMNAPWSTFICGSQGGGKSHTLSCLLENSLLSPSRTGELPNPLTGLVFHYDKFSSYNSTQFCEAAYLCSTGVPVRVLVSPTNETAMRKLYTNLPGLPSDSPRPDVVPLYFAPHHLDISNIMTLMAVKEEKTAPLYLHVLYQLLRTMVMENPSRQGINYQEFCHRLSQQDFTPAQRAPLVMRLQLLDFFLSAHENVGRIWNFQEGSLTIIDLSDPFINDNDACALFTICLRIFMAERGSCGRIVALDEAHKFLTQTGEAENFTEEMLSIIRQQRHLATRIVIATQEPTISPKLLDLCNVSIVHRFNSPAWFSALRDHLAGMKSEEQKGYDQDLFKKIVNLRAGEALLFCPTAGIDVKDSGSIVPMGNTFIKINIRSRLSTDGGRSIMASDQPETWKPSQRVWNDDGVDGNSKTTTQLVVGPFKDWSDHLGSEAFLGQKHKQPATAKDGFRPRAPVTANRSTGIGKHPTHAFSTNTTRSGAGVNTQKPSREFSFDPSTNWSVHPSPPVISATGSRLSDEGPPLREVSSQKLAADRKASLRSAAHTPVSSSKTDAPNSPKPKKKPNPSVEQVEAAFRDAIFTMLGQKTKGWTQADFDFGKYVVAAEKRLQLSPKQLNQMGFAQHVKGLCRHYSKEFFIVNDIRPPRLRSISWLE